MVKISLDVSDDVVQEILTEQARGIVWHINATIMTIREQQTWGLDEQESFLIQLQDLFRDLESHNKVIVYNGGEEVEPVARKVVYGKPLDYREEDSQEKGGPR